MYCSGPDCQTTAGCKCRNWWTTNAATLDGHVIEPERPWINQAASIICGHDWIQQRLFFAEQAEFETFIKEVLQTTAPSRS